MNIKLEEEYLQEGFPVLESNETPSKDGHRRTNKFVGSLFERQARQWFG